MNWPRPTQQSIVYSQFKISLLHEILQMILCCTIFNSVESEEKSKRATIIAVTTAVLVSLFIVAV